MTQIPTLPNTSDTLLTEDLVFQQIKVLFFLVLCIVSAFGGNELEMQARAWPWSKRTWPWDKRAWPWTKEQF